MSEQEDFRRTNDNLVITLSQKFNDFVERYDRDIGALNEWRRIKDTEIKEQGALLHEIAPAYNRGKWVVALIVIGSVSIAVKSFWTHLTWHG